MNAGFTLSEVLVSAVILTILVGGILSILNTGRATYHQEVGYLDLQQQGRQAMETMTKELREGTGMNITVISADDDQIYFNTTDESGILYYRDINDSNNDGISDQIIREYPAGIRKILANDIASIKFSQNNYLLEIRLQAKKTVQARELSFPLQSSVKLRNE